MGLVAADAGDLGGVASGWTDGEACVPRASGDVARHASWHVPHEEAGGGVDPVGGLVGGAVRPEDKVVDEGDVLTLAVELHRRTEGAMEDVGGEVHAPRAIAHHAIVPRVGEGTAREAVGRRRGVGAREVVGERRVLVALLAGVVELHIAEGRLPGEALVREVGHDDVGPVGVVGRLHVASKHHVARQQPHRPTEGHRLVLKRLLARVVAEAKRGGEGERFVVR
mmetsp:Transcript_53496/g.116236  ORF Transcript_53496/g.116236 Transcript_53496/m.116236 type:complete len:224 (+) Transcript_53496:2183-2854(+)